MFTKPLPIPVIVPFWTILEILGQIEATETKIEATKIEAQPAATETKIEAFPKSEH